MRGGKANCTAHTWNAWKTTKKATVTATGTRERTCSRCGKKETGTIAKLVCTHTWNAWKTTKQPTTKAEGTRERTCKNCGKKETGTVAKLPKATPTVAAKTDEWLWPVPTNHSWTSRCGWREISIRSSFHAGIDIGGKHNVVAPLDGVVKLRQWTEGGNSIYIKHGNGSQTVYFHLSEFNVEFEETVAKGARIATTGNTGQYTTATHLHFEVRRVYGNKATSINPLTEYTDNDKRSGKTNPNPIYIKQNGKYVFNPNFNLAFTDDYYTAVDLSSTNNKWKK